MSVGVALAHASLLAGVYFSSSIHTSAFVSTELGSLLYFRLTLTALVTAEAGISTVYILNLYSHAPQSATAAVSLVAAAVAGWAVLASYPSDRPEHMGGAVAFIAATAGYTIFFIAKSSRLRPALYSLWTLSVAEAGAFAGLYFAGLYEPAAALEWAAFTLSAVTLGLFFAVNPHIQQDRRPGTAAEAALPLLGWP